MDQQQDRKAKADKIVKKLNAKPRFHSLLSNEIRINKKGNEFLVPPESLVPADLVDLVRDEI